MVWFGFFFLKQTLQGDGDGSYCYILKVDYCLWVFSPNRSRFWPLHQWVLAFKQYLYWAPWSTKRKLAAEAQFRTKDVTWISEVSHGGFYNCLLQSFWEWRKGNSV